MTCSFPQVALPKIVQFMYILEVIDVAMDPSGRSLYPILHIDKPIEEGERWPRYLKKQKLMA
jgi:hypothetical protein